MALSLGQQFPEVNGHATNSTRAESSESVMARPGGVFEERRANSDPPTDKKPQGTDKHELNRFLGRILNSSDGSSDDDADISQCVIKPGEHSSVLCVVAPLRSSPV
jgi:hypothetical protein